MTQDEQEKVIELANKISTLRSMRGELLRIITGPMNESNASAFLHNLITPAITHGSIKTALYKNISSCITDTCRDEIDAVDKQLEALTVGEL